ncbi:hypothetical protein [Chryseobacterium sp. 18068]|uniref:hypothetical protein n=1 Tax=Chryseobacterium sp. 18068 TaxID=2681414 RepID=UPI0013595561|nr:hypothetical protein [Chryseobacterium sp. 18068]
MDNKPTEKLGENFIKSRLLKYDFEIHSDLSYDKDGADFMITQKLDSTKLHFIRIQSKARKIKNSTIVRIPKHYVGKNFVLFIYIIDEQKEENLFCFFSDDFAIFREKDLEYTLSITTSKIKFLQDNYSFNHYKAEKINAIFTELKRKKYTSLIIDGIFLEESIKETKDIYTEIWGKKFEEPSLKDLVEQIILRFNRFPENDNDIACYLYISNHHSLEDHLIIDNKNNSFSLKGSSIKIFITYTDELVAFQVMDDIDRFKQSNNIILIANDIIYENFLSDLEVDIESIIVARLKVNERPQEMYVKYKWGDISYPIGLALGLKSYEL